MAPPAYWRGCWNDNFSAPVTVILQLGGNSVQAIDPLGTSSVVFRKRRTGTCTGSVG